VTSPAAARWICCLKSKQKTVLLACAQAYSSKFCHSNPTQKCQKCVSPFGLAEPVILDTHSVVTHLITNNTHEETTAALVACRHSHVQRQITKSYVKCLSTAALDPPQALVHPVTHVHEGGSSRLASGSGTSGAQAQDHRGIQCQRLAVPP